MSVVLPAPKNPEIMSILVMVTQILSSNKAAGPPDETEGEGGAPDTRAWYPAHSSPGNYFCRTVISLRLGPVETRVMG